MTKKKSPRRDLLQAASLIKRGEQAAAMEIYAKILEQFPENRPAQAAIRSLESVKQTSPSISNQWKPEYESILELHNQGHAPQVVSRARIATEKFDSVYEFWEILGIASERTGDSTQARSAFQKAVELNPSNPTAHCNLGLCLNSVGEHAAAVRSIKKALNIDPNFAAGQYTLGVVLEAQNLKRPAMDAFRAAISIDPNHIDSHNNLAVILHQEGRTSEAIEHFEMAISSNPDFAEAHFNLGATLVEMGKHDQALKYLEKAIKIDPGHSAAFNNYGIALRALGDLESAVSALERALVLRPQYPEAMNNLANALVDEGQLEEAIDVYEKALRLRPHYPSALNGQGSAMRQLGYLDKAERKLQSALSLDPNYAAAHNNLGIVKGDMGFVSEANFHFHKASEIAPELISARRNLVTYHPKSINDQVLAELLTIWSKKNLSNLERCELGFALYEACKHLGQRKSAFKYLTLANKLRRSSLPYDPNVDINLFEALKSSSNAWANGTASCLENRPSPIFIVGMPRSGTTLVEQIISSHSEVQGLGELPYLMRNAMKLVDEGIEDFFSASQQLRERYYSNLEGHIGRELKFTDKLPQNFLWIPAILASFPEAKIVHVFRDAAATCWSIYEKFFPTTGLRFSYDLDDIARYYSLYKDLMVHHSDLVGDRVYHLSYERLTEAPQDEIASLAGHLEMNLEPAMLTPHLNSRAVSTASALQVRQQIYSGSSQNWREFREFLNGSLDELTYF